MSGINKELAGEGGYDVEAIIRHDMVKGTPYYTTMTPVGEGVPPGDRNLTRAGTAPVTPGRERHHRRMRTESSGDEDRPLDMTVLKPKNS